MSYSTQTQNLLRLNESLMLKFRLITPNTNQISFVDHYIEGMDKNRD
jgi:hypothetical protein